MNRLCKREPTLRFLHKSNPASQKAVVSRSNEELIKIFCHLCLNALSSRVPLTPYAKKKNSQNIKKKVFERFPIAELV